MAHCDFYQGLESPLPFRPQETHRAKKSTVPRDFFLQSHFNPLYPHSSFSFRRHRVQNPCFHLKLEYFFFFHRWTDYNPEGTEWNMSLSLRALLVFLAAIYSPRP